MLRSPRTFYKFIYLFISVSILWIVWHLCGSVPSYIGCPFKSVTGIPCPSCGMTTGVLSHLSGHHKEGFLSHPLAFIMIIMMCAVIIMAISDAISGRKRLFEYYLKVEKSFQNKWVVIVFTIFILSLWAYNILTKY